MKSTCSKASSVFQQVKHLQEVFNNPAPTEFVNDITVHESAFRQIEEELEEFDRDILTALIKRDGSAEDETVDWINDMIFFLLQYANKVGVLDRLPNDFYTIYLNNITKASDEDSVKQAQTMYALQNIDCYVEQNRFGDWLVKRKDDGKVMKPIGYEKVVL